MQKKMANLNFKKNCECGEHKECVRKVHSDKNGKIFVKTDEHLKCGMIKKQILKGVEFHNCYVRSKIGCHCTDNCELSDSLYNLPI